MLMLMAALVVAQSAQVGAVLVARGAAQMTRWDATTLKAAPMGEPIYAGEELATEGDGGFKILLNGEAVLTLLPDSKLVLQNFLNASAQLNVKLERGGVRIAVESGARSKIVVHAEAGSFTFEAGSDGFALVAEQKTQAVVVSGAINAASARTPDFAVRVKAGYAADLQGSVFNAGGASLKGLLAQADLDGTPLSDIAISLDTDLPGLVGPKRGNIRWRSVRESFGDQMAAAPPFEQVPLGAR